MQARTFYLHSTRFAACAHALNAPPLNCRPPSPVFSPRHAFASTHTAALHIRAPHAPRSLQSSHVPRSSAPDVLVFAHDPTHPRLRVPSTAVRARRTQSRLPHPLRPLVFAQISHARSHTIPHVLDPTRPAVRAHSRLRTTTSTPSSRLRTDLTRKAPRHTTATRTELTIPITRPLHYTSRPPLFPCLSTRGAIRLARLSSRIPGKMCRTLTRHSTLAASGVHLRGKVAPR